MSLEMEFKGEVPDVRRGKPLHLFLLEDMRNGRGLRLVFAIRLFTRSKALNPKYAGAGRNRADQHHPACILIQGKLFFDAPFDADTDKTV